jgi:DNA-binding Lrp family transcriptional regulator
MHRKNRPGFIAFRVLGLLLFVSGVWLSLTLNGLSIREQGVRISLNHLQRGGNVQSETILSRSRELVDNGVIPGQYMALYAKVLSLVYESDSSRDLYALESVVDAYENALAYNPFNGELWSRYAVYASQVKGLENRVLVAMDGALRFGKNDYHTLKDLIFVGIKEWPRLNCHYKTLMLDRISAGLKKNDVILSRWNRERRNMSIGQYTTALMTYFNFNESWAETQVIVCSGKIV